MPSFGWMACSDVLEILGVIFMRQFTEQSDQEKIFTNTSSWNDSVMKACIKEKSRNANTENNKI